MPPLPHRPRRRLLLLLLLLRLRLRLRVAVPPRRQPATAITALAVIAAAAAAAPTGAATALPAHRGAERAMEEGQEAEDHDGAAVLVQADGEGGEAGQGRARAGRAADDDVDLLGHPRVEEAARHARVELGGAALAQEAVGVGVGWLWGGGGGVVRAGERGPLRGANNGTRRWEGLVNE